MVQPSKTRISNAWICQVDGMEIQPIFGDILIEDGTISKIIHKDFQIYLQKHSVTEDHALNAAGRIVTLPLINFHDHFYSRLAKGLNIKGPMDNFNNILHNLWWKLDRTLDLNMVRVCAKIAAIESIKNGVTYIFDHHSSPTHSKNSLSIISEILYEFGLRGVLCFETSDRDGAEFSRKALEENVNFIKHSTSRDIKSMLGLHASFTLSDDTLQEASEIIQKYDLGIHIHLCEDKIDREKSKEITEYFPVERLMNYRLINSKSILAHGIYLTSEDYNTISEYGSAIVYNLDSNLNNAVGLPTYSNVPESIPRLLGTDGMHSNIARSFKQLFLLYRHQGASFDDAFQLIRKIYFDQLTFVKRYFSDYPSIQQGDRADLIIWDYVPPTPITKDNFWGHFLYGIIERKVESVIHNGRVLMKHNILLDVDEEALNVEIYNQGEKLFNKFQ